MALFAGGEVTALVGVVVAAVQVDVREHAADVGTSWTTHSRRSAGVTLTSVRVIWTVEGVVVANIHRFTGVDGRSEVAADVVARASCKFHWIL